MKRYAVFALVLLLAGSLSAKEEHQKWKVLQVKHLTVNSGVNLSPEDLGYFYEGLVDELRRMKLAEQVLDDGATVPQEIAADSVVMEGTITYLEQGSFPSRSTRMHAEFKLYRVSDHRLIMTKIWLDDQLGRMERHGKNWRIGGIIAAVEVKRTAKELQPLSSFSPAAPPGANSALSGAVPAPSPSPAPAVPQVFTSVQLSSNPTGAEITIDGNYAGNTPSLIKLKPGAHSIKVTQKGYMPWVRSINIDAGESRNLAAVLEKTNQ